MKFFSILKKLENRELLFSLIKSKLLQENKATALGAVWLFLYPLLTMIVYGLVFAYIFQVKKQGMPISSYVMIIFSGWMFYWTLSDNLRDGANVFIQNRNYLSKLPIDKKLFLYATVLRNYIKQLIFYVIYILFFVVLHGTAHWVFLFYPFLMLTFMVTCYCFALVLSIITPIFRDFGNILGIIIRLLMYLSPIFYTLDRFEDKGVRNLVMILNPLASYIEIFRSFIMHSSLENYTIPLVSILGWSLLFYFAGSYLFNKNEKNIIDII